MVVLCFGRGLRLRIGDTISPVTPLPIPIDPCCLASFSNFDQSSPGYTTFLDGCLRRELANDFKEGS